jgi:hypothetical protein
MVASRSVDRALISRRSFAFAVSLAVQSLKPPSATRFPTRHRRKISGLYPALRSSGLAPLACPVALPAFPYAPRMPHLSRYPQIPLFPHTYELHEI